MIRRSLWIWLLFVVHCVAGQMNSAKTAMPNSTAGLADRYFFRHLTTKNGLSYNLVNCLYQDREGYIWVGTFNGLNRYDGSRFVVFKYDRANPQSIAHNNIIDICEDRSGDVWIATPNGVSHYHKQSNRFTNYKLDLESATDFGPNEASNILCDRQGTIWVTSSGGLYRFMPGRNAFQAYRHDPKNVRTIRPAHIFRNALVEDPYRPYLWIGTVKGLHCFDQSRQEFYHADYNPLRMPVFNRFRAVPLAIDRQDHLVFGNYEMSQSAYGQLVQYSLRTHAVTTTRQAVELNDHYEPTELSSIAFDAQNNLWLSCWNGLVYTHESASGGWSRFKHDPDNPTSIGSEFFWDWLQARDGTIYIGGLYGLSICTPAASLVTVHKPALGLSPITNPVNFLTLAQDSSGTVWLGENGRGLLGYNLQTRRSAHYLVSDEPKSPRNVINRLAYIDHELWLSTAKGIHIFNPTARQFRPFKASSPYQFFNESEILWCYQDRQRHLWISVANRGLYQYNPSSGYCRKHNPDSLFISPVRTTHIKRVREDKQGRIWLASASGRLYGYDRRRDRYSAPVVSPNQVPKVLQQPINDLYIDPADRLWLATEGGGLVKYNPAKNTFTAWMETDGLQMDVCRSVLADRQGKIWVGTYEGFTIFDPSRETIENPKIDYGQRENDFFSRSWTLLKNGDIAFLSQSNLVVLNPQQRPRQKIQPAPIVSGITVFGKARPLYQNIRQVALSYQQNFFTLDYSVLKAPQEAVLDYAYRLVGYDPNWVSVGSRTFAAYTGVKGGQYQFEVKARYKDGRWGPTAVLPIFIRPPFWERGWFQLSVFLSVIGLIIYSIKNRERRLLRQEREKSGDRERLMASEMKALRAQMNPHFLFNSLNAIRLFVLQNDSDNAENFIVKFARLMRLILDNSRQEWVALDSELDQLRLYLELEQLRFDNTFDFALQTDPTLDTQAIAIPPMIIQPYIENAILHGMAHKKSQGHIAVSITRAEKQLMCVVDDDGVGRQQARALKSQSGLGHKSVGLRVTEERLQLIGQRLGQDASVKIIDKVDVNGEPAGTQVIVQLPLMTLHNLPTV